MGFILNPVISFFEKRRVPTFLAILLAVIISFLVLNFFGVLVYTSIKSFTTEFPQYEIKLRGWYDSIIQFLNIPPEVIAAQKNVQSGLDWFNSIRELSLHKMVLSTLSSIVNFMSNTFLVILFLIFILIGRNQLASKVLRAFRDNTAERISEIVQNVNAQIQKYLIAKTLISFATGCLFGIILFSFDVEFAVIWAILAFLLNFIPTVGSVVATLLPLSIAFLQFESFTTLFWLAILLVAVQGVIGNFIDPRVVGRSLNLSPLVVLFSLIFWGWMWGVLGMFLAVPISVIMKIVFENISSLRFISVLMSGNKSTADN